MEKQHPSADEKTYGILAIMKATGMRWKEVLSHIGSEKIYAEKQGRLYTFTEEEMNRLKGLHDEHIGVWCMVRDQIHEGSAFSLRKRSCRDEFLEFVKRNGWFGVKALSVQAVFFAAADDEQYFILKADAERIRDRVALWLDSYGCDDCEKLRLLLKRIDDIYPKTGKWLAAFVKSGDVNKTAAWRLADYLCDTLQGELTETSEDELERLAAAMDKDLPLGSARLFTEFLMFLREHSDMKNGWTYHFGARHESANTEAYPTTDFLKMAYVVFNGGRFELTEQGFAVLRST